MAEFHNPYHFTPLRSSPDLGHEEWIDKHVTHERQVPGTHTGTITCKITVETPTLCGNAQKERDQLCKLIQPFDINGEPAIPGSQLRGMISSVAEAVSGSAMRILDGDMPYSYRNRREDGLTALGMVVIKNGKHYIYPLASPNYVKFDQSPEPRFEVATWNSLPNHKGGRYDIMFPSYRPKISFGSQSDFRTAAFLDCFKSSQSPISGPFYGLSGNIIPHRHDKQDDRGNYNLHFMLGEKPAHGVGQINIKQWDAIPDAQRNKYTRGVVRVLGGNPERSLPGKKHEYFLRFSAEDEQAVESGAGLYPISKEAVDRFNQLGDERAKAENDPDTPEHLKHPLGPNGVPRRAEEGERLDHDEYRLKHGEVVFFRPSASGLEVAEVSISGIWRDRVEVDANTPSSQASMRQFLEHCGMLDLLPWGPERGKLTLAEQVFGTVSHPEYGDPDKQALGGRVHVGNAHLSSGPGWLPAISRFSPGQTQFAEQYGLVDLPLLNLSSPKPPCPALYFKPIQGGGGYIKKRDLNPREHVPQGRKFYLRRPKEGANDPHSIEHYVGGENLFVHTDILRDDNNRARLINQHQSAEKFIAPGSIFTLEIRFANLSDLELNLIMYSVSPTPEFRHQIGHGKPFGLGQMELEITEIQFLNASERYKSDTWGRSEGLSSIEGTKTLQALAKARADYKVWARSNDLSPCLAAMELIGDPGKVAHPVHYPQVAGTTHQDMNFHEEHFKWFVANDSEKQRSSAQYLRPIASETGQVPAKMPSLFRETRLCPPEPIYPPTFLEGLTEGMTLPGVVVHKINPTGRVTSAMVIFSPDDPEAKLLLIRSQTPGNEFPAEGSEITVKIIPNPNRQGELMCTMLGVQQATPQEAG